MRILYVATRYDYGLPERGPSFEHWNFYHTFHSLGCDIIYFDYMHLLQAHGRERMNQLLAEVARHEQADLMFSVLFQEQFDERTIRDISAAGRFPTLNWFCDDQWRFEEFACRWAPCFTWVVTTAPSAVEKYERIGYRHAIKSQYACNHFLYRKLDLPLKHDITFVGAVHGERRAYIDLLRDAGIDVQAWGSGWENGRLSQEGMIEVFNQSRINLNFSAVSSPKPSVRQDVRKYGSRLVSAIPFGQPLKAAVRSLVRRKPPAQTVAKDAISPQYVEQIKGRNFEVPGCGGFMLTAPAEDLHNYYDLDREVDVFETPARLIERVQHFRRHEDERANRAQAGFERTLREHTYAHRFADIFRRIGLPSSPPGEPLPVASSPGQTVHIE